MAKATKATAPTNDKIVEPVYNGAGGCACGVMHVTKK